MTSMLFSEISDSPVAQALSSPIHWEWPVNEESFPSLRTWGETAQWLNIRGPFYEEKMSHQSIRISVPETRTSYRPRTPLGKKLLELRMQAIQKGMKLLSEDEILQEVKRRRGELDDDEENLH